MPGTTSRRGDMALRVVTFKMDDDDLTYISTLAREAGITRSRLIRCAVAYMVAAATGYKLSMYNDCDSVYKALLDTANTPVFYRRVRLES